MFLEISLNSHEACNFIKKETLTQVFSCEFCEISKNSFFHRTPLIAAPGVSIMSFLLLRLYRLVKKYMSLSNGRWLIWSALLMKCIQHLYRNRLLAWLSLKQWSKYSLCKICQSKCFLRPAFFLHKDRIFNYTLSRENDAQRKPVLWDILRSD